MNFELKDRDAAGRICTFTTKNGTVRSPNLLPVINPNKMPISPKEMKQLFGTEMVITNSYIIYKDPELREKALKNGVHKLINFDGPIMTDSGTFQSYVYGDINLDPIEIVEFQRDIRSDVGTILDVFGTPQQTKTEAEHGMLETIHRARQSVKVKQGMLLACTVQGSIYPDLREKCAQELSKLDADFFPIGGVVPLMENQRYSDLVRCIISSKKGLNPSKPVHLFGAGHPLLFPLAVALGCDFFDSSAYIKYANDGRMIFPWGTEKLDDLPELPCCCPVCTEFTASELKKMENDEAIIQVAKHNLYVSFAEIKRIRSAIAEGTLWELVERRATANPYLLRALSELRTKENKQWLAQVEPLSRQRAVFYTGNHTIHRPLIYRTHQRLLHRYKLLFDTTVVFPEGKKPYSNYYYQHIRELLEKRNVNIVVRSSCGPVPIELDEMYPFAQSVFPDVVDEETEKEAHRVFDTFTKNTNVLLWKGRRTLKELDASKENPVDMDHWRISAVADIQFGKGASKALFKGNVKIVKSQKTGKIRNVYRDGKHLVSLRAEDGLFTLRINGGRLLHNHFTYPTLRVVIHDDAIPFVKDGKSVFAKFVVACDPDLIPLDECLIVDKNDTLVAVGRTILNPHEMAAFNCGVAVKTRETS
jgi:7-cyano-7-deazaguanine tRNA-ribosyltransferase